MLYLTTYAGLLFARFTQKRGLYGAVLVALFLFSAFRFEVGCDWSGYWFQYQAQMGAGWNAALENREPLWWLVVELTQRIGLSYPWLNVSSSAIFFIGVHAFARRQPDPLGFLILLFPVLIVNMPMSGIRQGAAVGLICIALCGFLDRRLVKFVAFVVLAAGFHSSAIVFLLLAPLVWGNYTKWRIAMAGLLAVPGVFLLTSGGDAEVAFSRYVDTDIDAFGAAYRTGVLFLSGVFFFVFLRRQWFFAFPRDYKLASLGALMMMAVFPLVAFSTVIADRLGYYFIPLQAMIFARVPFLRGGTTGRLLTVAPYVGLALLFVVWTFTSSHFQQCYVPYKTWLFGFPEGRYFF